MTGNGNARDKARIAVPRRYVMIMETTGHRSFWGAEMFFLFRAAQRRPKKEKHFSTPKRTMPGGFHNHDVPPGDGDAGLVPRVSGPRHPPE